VAEDHEKARKTKLEKEKTLKTDVIGNPPPKKKGAINGKAEKKKNNGKIKSKSNGKISETMI